MSKEQGQTQPLPVSAFFYRSFISWFSGRYA